MTRREHLRRNPGPITVSPQVDEVHARKAFEGHDADHPGPRRRASRPCLSFTSLRDTIPSNQCCLGDRPRRVPSHFFGRLMADEIELLVDESQLVTAAWEELGVPVEGLRVETCSRPTTMPSPAKRSRTFERRRTGNPDAAYRFDASGPDHRAMPDVAVINAAAADPPVREPAEQRSVHDCGRSSLYAQQPVVSAPSRNHSPRRKLVSSGDRPSGRGNGLQVGRVSNASKPTASMAMPGTPSAKVQIATVNSAHSMGAEG